MFISKEWPIDYFKIHRLVSVYYNCNTIIRQQYLYDNINNETMDNIILHRKTHGIDIMIHLLLILTMIVHREVKTNKKN
jgi:hypothetical protein